MRNAKKGFTLIELLIVVVIVGILALAAIPLITANTRDARMAEGREMLGSMRNQARVFYSKAAIKPGSLTDCNVTAEQRLGQFYQVLDPVVDNGTSGELTADSLGTDPQLILTFGWEDGSSVFNIP